MVLRFLASEKRSGTKSHLVALGWLNLALWGIAGLCGVCGYVSGSEARCMVWFHADWIWSFTRGMD